jgi:hypothetical protein
MVLIRIFQARKRGESNTGKTMSMILLYIIQWYDLVRLIKTDGHPGRF